MPLCIFLVLFNAICQVPAVTKTPSVFQDSGIIRAEVGHEVTLECFCQDEAVTFLSWYQQSLGSQPRIISRRMKHKTEADIYPVYKERFKVVTQSSDGSNHLKITDVRLSDSATYYCGILEFNAIEFGQGAFLHVKTSQSNIQAVVQQPALEPRWLGGTVNLSCTVYPEPCAGDLSLYWFRQDASQPAVISPSTEQCTSLSNETPIVKKCSLNLAIKSVSMSDAGVYYCAMASCGEIVFGNGTRVVISGDSFLVYCLSVAFAVSVILLVLLAFIMHRLKKRLCSVCTGSSSPLTSHTMSQDADMLHYAALNLNRNGSRQRQEDHVENTCVYSRVKSRK
ncbi:uncharacterized protein LOC113143911 [Mastacembelus armatus]|uniref:Uncharacterized LOC113143911 n=1 Tax=Mastacembelus armatus TaxID=205130 RepID=A0A3Q3LIY6_9TELE|nr:uncharacterized protein LOC113143911 [Mastacembelus armatus]